MAQTAGISATLSLNASAFTAGLNAGTQATRRFAQQTSAAMRMSQDQLNAVAASAGRTASQMRRAGSAIGSAGGGATNSGMGMLMLSQAVDDVQYGFKGIVNNIAPLVLALGGSSGLAGALTIAAVGINQLINKWDQLNAVQENAKLSARNAETYAKVQADALRAAAEAGSASGDFAAARLGRQDAGRAAQDRASARALTGSGATDREILDAKIRLAEERLAADQTQQAALAQRLKESREEIAQIEAREKARRSYGGISPADQQRAKFLQEEMKGLQEARAATETRSGATFQDLEDLKLERTRTALREAVTDIGESATTAARALAAIGRRADAESAAAMREAEARAAQIQRFDEWGDAMRAAAEATRQEIAARQAAMRKANEDIQIQHLRSRGRGAAADRLESKVTRERRVEDLVKEGRPRAEAEAIARQEERDRRGGSGQRLPRTDTKRPSPLDEDRRARGLRPETPLDEAARRPRLKRPAAGDPAPAGKEDANILTGLKELGTTLRDKLQELINATRTPVADGIKPVNG